ncbi:MAG: hypothetical protein HQL67_04535 [Magnetococcales bacterium]|nr:hypothetical protein [Magnetococcales bacterium]
MNSSQYSFSNRQGGETMLFIKKIPLFALLLLIYNLVAFAHLYQPQLTLQTLVAQINLGSGTVFLCNIGDLLVISGLGLVYLELLKYTKTTKPHLTEHLLSLGVFVLFMVEFFLVAEAGTMVFLLLTIMSLLDLIGGLSVTLSRHIVIAGTAAGLALEAARQANSTQPSEESTPDTPPGREDANSEETPVDDTLDTEPQAEKNENDPPGIINLREREKSNV